MISSQYLGIFTLFITTAVTECYLTCRSCIHAPLPSQCDNIIQCKQNEHCLIQKIQQNGQTYFNSGCVPVSSCSTTPNQPIGRRWLLGQDNVVCSECCSQDHCNAVGCGSMALECGQKLKDGYFYDSVTDMCAKVVKSQTAAYNQSEAAALCAREGTRLISIKSEAEQYFLLSWIFTGFHKSEDFWIGLRSFETTGNQYRWADGRPVSYKNWGRGYPEQPSDVWTGDEDCVFINSKDDNSWHDDHCGRMLSGYICQIWNITNPTQTIEDRCRQKVREGYLYDRNTDICIRLRESAADQFTHAVAEHDCQRDDATLAIIDTQKKWELLQWWMYSTNDNGTDFWIGAQDVSRNTSVFVWPNGVNVSSTFHNWGGPDFTSKQQSQPDGQKSSRNEGCVYMDHTQQYKWYDENCDSLKTGFICQHFGNTSFLSETIDNCLFRLQRGYFYDPCTRMCIEMKESPPISRTQAEQICELNGDRLVEVDSEVKMNYLTYMAQSLQKTNSDFWVGALDPNLDGHFVWEYTKTPLRYSNWFRVSPQPVRHCVVLDHDDKYRWTPTQCSTRKHGYICHLDGSLIASSRL